MSQKLYLALSATVLFMTSSFVMAQEVTQGDKTPTPRFQCGVLMDDADLLAVNLDGQLLAVDTASGGERDFGTLDKEFGPHFDVANDNAYLLTDEYINEVQLSSGRIARTAKQSIGRGGKVGVIDKNRVFVYDRTRLEIIDLEKQSMLHSVALGDKQNGYRIGPTTIAHARYKDRLFVVTSNGNEIAEVDLNHGKLIRRIDSSFGSTTSLVVAGDKLYASKLGISYGIVLESLVAIDLETQHLQVVEFPDADEADREFLLYGDKSYVEISMIPGQDGGFCVAARQGVFQYSEEGKLVSRASPLRPGQRLIAVTENGGLVSDTEGLGHLEFATVETAAK